MILLSFCLQRRSPTRVSAKRLLADAIEALDRWHDNFADLLERIDRTNGDRERGQALYSAWFEQLEKGTLLDQRARQGRTLRIWFHEVVPALRDILAEVEGALVAWAAYSESSGLVLRSFQKHPMVKNLDRWLALYPYRVLDGVTSLIVLLREAVKRHPGEEKVGKTITEKASDVEPKVERHVDSKEVPDGSVDDATCVKPEFPKRAEWVKEALCIRAWSTHDVERNRGPEHRTMAKILSGYGVRPDVLERLVTSLSSYRETVRLSDVPND